MVFRIIFVERSCRKLSNCSAVAPLTGVFVTWLTTLSRVVAFLNVTCAAIPADPAGNP